MLLDVCVNIFRYRTNNNIKPIDLSHSIYNIVKSGSQFSYLEEDFDELIKHTEHIIREIERGAVLNEWLKIALIIVRYVSR